MHNNTIQLHNNTIQLTTQIHHNNGNSNNKWKAALRRIFNPITVFYLFMNFGGVLMMILIWYFTRKRNSLLALRSSPAPHPRASLPSPSTTTTSSAPARSSSSSTFSFRTRTPLPSTSILQNLPPSMWDHIRCHLRPVDIQLIQQLSLYFYDLSWTHLIDELHLSPSITSPRFLHYTTRLANPSLVRTVRVASSEHVRDHSLCGLAGFTILTTLQLTDDRLLGDGLRHLMSLTSLTRLDLSLNRHLTNASLTSLAPLTNLQRLSLASCFDLSYGLAHLKALTSLRSLTLSGCVEVRDRDLCHLLSLQRLRHLDLSYCDFLTDEGVANLSQRLTGLTELRMRCCTAATEAGLQFLSSLTALTLLDVGGCAVSVRALKPVVTAVPGLRKLDLNGCPQAADVGSVLVLLNKDLTVKVKSNVFV